MPGDDRISVDASSGQVQYTGPWTLIQSVVRTDPMRLHTTAVNGSTATFIFSGTSIQVEGTIFATQEGQTPPSALYQLNDTVYSLNAQPSTRENINGQTLFQAGSLPPGQTTLTITVLTNGTTYSLDNFFFTKAPNMQFEQMNMNMKHSKDGNNSSDGSQREMFEMGEQSAYKAMRTAAAVGAVLGGLILAGLIIGGFLFYRRWKQRKITKSLRCPPGRSKCPEDGMNKCYSTISCRHNIQSRHSFDPSWVAGAIPTFTSLGEKVVVDMGYSPQQRSNVTPSPAFATRSVAERSVSVRSPRSAPASRFEVPLPPRS